MGSGMGARSAADRGVGWGLCRGLDRGLQTELVWGVNGDWIVGWVGASKGTELKAGWGPERGLEWGLGRGLIGDYKRG